MQRDIEKEFSKWAENKNKMPLIIRGARQVGKSYLVENCSKQLFKNVVVCNFEFNPSLKDCFSSFEPSEILNKIRLLTGEEITENTLLFLDEIQECPKAIMALRYFKEKMPSQSVVCAGSLLEFAMNNENFSMPVGRVSFLYLTPLSFGEFLTAVGEQNLRSYLGGVSVDDKIDVSIHNKLIELLKIYFITGGMPASVQEYINTKNLASVSQLQSNLLATYKNDFGKYAKASKRQYLEKILNFVPRFVGQRIKYSTIDSDIRSVYLKEAIYLLSLSGLIKPNFSTTASGIPLQSEINEKKFKLNFLDVGLMQNICGLKPENLITNDLMLINNGAIVEQFVGQELVAYGSHDTDKQLHFWTREKNGSMAEVDFVISNKLDIIPIEVKSGKTGKLKSLRLFMQEKKSELAVRFSQEELSFYDGILSIPLYMVEQTTRLIESCIN